MQVRLIAPDESLGWCVDGGGAVICCVCTHADTFVLRRAATIGFVGPLIVRCELRSAASRWAYLYGEYCIADEMV